MKIKLISTGTFVPILSDSICNLLKLGLINLHLICIVYWRDFSPIKVVGYLFVWAKFITLLVSLLTVVVQNVCTSKDHLFICA